jgi:hypothetical protein
VIIMGFNKRILRKDNIINNLDNLSRYLSADAIIISDDFSNEVFKMFCEGKTEDEIIKYINKNK